jgi:hypothetical protein
MDNYRGSDAEVENLIDGEGEDDWADSHVIRRIAEGLREAYVKPLDSATQSRHLAAIADAISQNARGPRALPPAQRPVMDGSRCASTFVRAAGPTRVAKVSNVSLASPFGARSASASSGPVRPGPPTSLSSVENPAEPKTAQRWMRSGAFVNSITSKAAVVATAIAMSASGLAIAGALPDPVQTAFSEAAGVIGLDIPTPIQPPATSPAPPREQAVPAPTLPVPDLVVPQEPLPAPVVPAPPPTQTSAVQAPPQAAPIVPPAASATDLESWMTELIRQALAAANAKATYPQAQTGAGTGQQSGYAGQSSAQDNPWESYGWSGSQSKPKTTSASPAPSPSPSQYGYPQGRSQSRPAGTAN